MNKVIQATLTGLLLLAASANASPERDIQQIRPLLPAGTDVAQIQASIFRGSSEAVAINDAKDNYVIRDINGDGKEDILVISEEQPRFENSETNQPCTSSNDVYCNIVYGKRALHLFYGQADGSMKLVFTNNKMVLGGDDGGVWGDPLEGLTVTNRGTIQLAVYGGSAWRWSYSDTLQFRDGHLVVIGLDSYYGWNGDLRSDTKSINYITGRVVETHQKNGDAPVKTKIYRIAVQPLVKVADYTGAMTE